jgi:hypothetical protein
MGISILSGRIAGEVRYLASAISERVRRLFALVFNSPFRLAVRCNTTLIRAQSSRIQPPASRPPGAIRNRRASPCDYGLPNPLPRLPAVGDNVTMESEPPKAEPPKRKRRWLQFSLRTLMIFVTLIATAAWVVADRQRLIRERDDALEGEQATKKRFCDLRIPYMNLRERASILEQKLRIAEEILRQAKEEPRNK